MNRIIVSARSVFSAIRKFPTTQPRTLAQPVALALLLAAGLSEVTHAQVIGYWQFNEKLPGNNCDTTPGAILDSSGNGNNGTEPNPLPYIAGHPGYGNTSALAFNQITTNRVLVPDPSGAFNWSPGQSVTMEAVVRTVNIGSSTTGTILAKQIASPGEWYWRITPTGVQRLSATDGTGLRSAVGTRVLNDGQWHHLAAVYDAAAQRMQVYVDYVADGPGIATTFSVNPIGNTNDLWIGQQQSGANRLDGDIDFIRFSLGALTPDNFIQPQTYLANIAPTNNAIYISATNSASFSVISPTIGVASSNIAVTVNGNNVTSQLVFSGNNNNRTVTLPPLVANRFYEVQATVTDLAGYQFSQAWQFNTFAVNAFSIEGEDYNFGGGQFIDNPQLSSVPGPNNYLDRIGTEGVDFHQIGAPALTQYRIGDLAGTAISLDSLRQAYLDAQVFDPGVTDYMAQDNVDAEWLNYTRTFPAGTYHVYARVAKAATTPFVMSVSEVTSGSTTTTQITTPIAKFQAASTGSASTYQFVPLTDAIGKNVGRSLSGVRTLRQTFVSGSAGVLLNYLVFVPVGSPQVPYLTQVSPAAGAANEAFFATIQASLQNADTTVVTNTIQLKLDGTTVSPTITGTTLGVDISYSPLTMSTGLHTATLIFTDSAATSVTNQWQFVVSRAAPVFTTSVWTNTSGGLWSGTTNWANGIVANGSGVTADFSTRTLTANATVSLNTPTTVGYLVFADQGNAFNWTIADGGSGPLTFDSGTNKPVITVLNNRNTTIGTTLATYQELQKAGPGTLTLTAVNTYTGGTKISAGTLQLGAFSGGTARAGAGPIQVDASGTLTLAYAAAVGNFANNLTGTGTIIQNSSVETGLTGTNTFSGLIQINSNKIAFASANSADGAPRLAIASGAVMSVGASFVVGALNLSELSGGGAINPTFGATTGFRTMNVNQSSTTTFSGSIKDGSANRFIALTKSGPGTLILNNSGNTYSGATAVNGGTLLVNNTTGTGVGPGAVTVANGATLGGSGIIGGAITVDAGGWILAGNNTVGTLTLNNGLSLNGNLAFFLNKSLTPSNSIINVVGGSLNNGGTGVLAVTNVGPALVVGDKFTLFNQALPGGQNLTIIPPTGVTFANNLATDGSITVLTAPLVNATPTNISFTVSAGQLTLSWPQDHTGWTLQAQTNALNAGLGTNWFPVASSTTTNQIIVPVNPANPAVFYRLVLP